MKEANTKTGKHTPTRVETECPYFLEQLNSRALRCSGPDPECSMVLRFDRGSVFDYYVGHYCNASYGSCPMNEMLTQYQSGTV